MRYLLTVICLLLTSCAGPDLRFWQATVPQAPTVTGDQRESWAQGAKYVRDALSIAVGLGELSGEKLGATHAVAVSLSRSIGEPKKPSTDATAIIASLESELDKERRENQARADWMRKYAGHEVEDTGFDLAGLATSGGVMVFVAVLVFVPGAMSVLLLIIRRLRKTLTAVVTGIEGFKQAQPDLVPALETQLRGPMDRAHKQVVKKIRKSF